MLLSSRNIPALILAFTAASAYAEPYRPLPRLEPAKVKQRAAETARLQRTLSQPGPRAPAMIVKHDIGGDALGVDLSAAPQMAARMATVAAADPAPAPQD
ncbi:MAG: hypothetical protein ACJ79E_11710, partial [Anaeromyxobacteraceae bacterium]